MKFGNFPVRDAVGGILAHSLRLPDDSTLRKGTVLDEDLVDLLLAASIEEVLVALPETGDVSENDAAALVAECLSDENLRLDVAKTGRVNIFSKANGIFCASREKIDAANAIDPGITIATLEDQAEVNEGRMVATIKIIPYTVPASSIAAVKALDLVGAISLKPYTAKKVGLISTLLPGTKHSVLDKTRVLLERRLSLSGSVVVEEKRVFHMQDDVREAIESFKDECELLVIFGASAISDIRDIIPASIKETGGEIHRFGMPVDPGNLLLLGELGNLPVIGAPGCARSPAENGFDWVLQKILSGAKPSDIDFTSMGVGGLLMETGSRPHPRLGKTSASGKRAGIILAAGQSRRMGDVNKMTAEVNGKAMVRHVAEAALSSKLDKIFVVTGHKPDEVVTALDGLDVEFVENPDFAGGLSTSLSAGVCALNSEFAAAMVLLGDMPFVSSANIDAMLEAQAPGAIVMATADGKRGNPVLWPRNFFEELTRIEGDIGARHIIGANADRVVEVELGAAAATDLDTPEAIKSALNS